MQKTSLTNKIIHWLMNEMVVKKMDTGSTDYLSPLGKKQALSKIRHTVGIVHMFGRKYDKPYQLFNCERPDVDSLE